MFQEYSYQTGAMLRRAVESQAALSGDSLTRIEEKLDAALNGAASSITPASRQVLRETVLARARIQLASRTQRQGMNANTGRLLIGIDHLHQSIARILLTVIGSEVMRRKFGSRLLELISQPYNTATVLQIYAAVADALRQWEPRFTLARIQPRRKTVAEQASDKEKGTLELILNGNYLGAPVTVGVML